MTDTDGLVAILLADRAPSLRYRVLLELLDAPPTDPQVVALAQQIPASNEVRAALAAQPADAKDLSWVLCQLTYLGVPRTDPRISALAERLFLVQRDDGAFPFAAFAESHRLSAYDMIPLQTALPLRGLAAAGYAQDPRAERAFEWLLAQRLDDGSWPTGSAAGQRGFTAGYRKLPGSRGCRTNTTGALACLALHPNRARSSAARTALDLLLQRETREEATLGSEVARLIGIEPAAGFFTFYAQFDLASLLDISSRIGVSSADPRVAALVEHLRRRRGPYGLWEHPRHPQASRWLTFDLLASLKRLQAGDWIGVAPRLPLRGLPRQRRRS